MRIMVFAEGTVIMHRGGAGHAREEIVQQVAAGSDASIHDFTAYIPIGDAVSKLRAWREQGARILYLTSRTNGPQVAEIAGVLRRHGFPNGPLLHRAQGEHYGVVAERELPDVLIEDDCESIGGKQEMTIAHVSPQARRKIKSVRVHEFEGIDHLPDALMELIAG